MLLVAAPIRAPRFGAVVGRACERGSLFHADRCQRSVVSAAYPASAGSASTGDGDECE